MQKTFVFALIAVLLAGAAVAELQNVTVGGNIRIRGSFYDSEAGGDTPRGRNPLVNGPFYQSFGVANPAAGFRWPALPPRALGTRGGAIFSPLSWNEDGHATKFVEQRTRVNVCADFSDEVTAFIELDSWDVWGTDFRSNYITGADGPGVTNDDVEVYQAYIEAREMWGYPVSMKIGRQEISLGSEWLVGTNDASSFFTGLSFDGITVTYASDLFNVTGVWAKLAERSPIEEDGDVDMYGVYGTYTGFENIAIDAYWMLVRDGRMLADTQAGWIAEWFEDLFGVDDYDVTNLHTLGLRGAGTFGALDFEAEAAWQFGQADQYGFLFSPLVYGDDSADFSEWGANLEVGYTFDMAYTPRVFLGAAYFGGEDNRDVNFWQYVRSFFPYYQADASVSFNRLFSNWEYSEFLDATDLTNCWIARGGVSAQVTESIEVMLTASYFQTLETFDAPWHFFVLGQRFIPLQGLPFLTNENDNDLGWEVALSATYNYTEDLSFNAGWSHLFVGNGLEEGNFNNANGLGFNGGTGDDDADYLWIETQIKF